ncbi:hypothetical protein CFE70_005030 [Pyrenophora teres f. teres 0-1]
MPNNNNNNDITLATLPFITRETLAEKLKPSTSSPSPSLAIIDVRDADHIGGHIKGSTEKERETAKDRGSLIIHPLKLHNRIHLLRTRTRAIKPIPQPLPDEPPGQLDAHDALAHTQHLGIITQHGALDGEAVVRRDGADAGDLVCGNGDPEACSADEEGAVGLARGDELGGCDGNVGVCCFVCGFGHADVGDGGDEGRGREVGFERVFVADAGVVAADCYAEGGW